MQDKSHDLRVAVELMLRSYFGRISAEFSGVKAAQDFHTKQILLSIGGTEASTAFVHSTIDLHSDRGVSPIWLSPVFTLPVFALAAADMQKHLSPTGQASITVDLAVDDSAFFGVRLAGIKADIRNENDQHYFTLCALAGTKFYLEADVGKRDTHDLVRRRIEALRGNDY